MSCSPRLNNFQFPDGAPLTDNPVTNLNAQYLFLPYGTLLSKGEIIRIWLENGKTKEVLIADKWQLDYSQGAVVALGRDEPLPWQLVALDTGFELFDILNWPTHDLANPLSPPVVLEFKHPLELKPSWKMLFWQFVYKIRNLGH